ncbi:MAG: hypothetical protein FJ271_13825 [Planctomycetes bacterium]|nr:hypothetical protein [Planctomycetota bacterium]
MLPRVCCLCAAVVPFLIAVGLTRVRPQSKVTDTAAEDAIHTPAGFQRPGKPMVASEATGTLEVEVVDPAGKPTSCRVNVVGADGNFYEPASNPLAAWSLHRLGNRPDKGPFRYYGWFFYTNGSFKVKVPEGTTRIEVWKGYEFRPATITAKMSAGETRKMRIELRRTVALAELGYYSGDTHIHMDRTTAADDARALDLLAAEDIRFGFILCMNDPRFYTGAMKRQIWPQTNGFGPTSIKEGGGYSIVSGQEYRCSTFGHICLFMHRRLVLEDETVDPNNWPVFGKVGLETRELGGFSFHAHGGYSREILADFAQRTTDGVELLQFAEYRGIALQGWYKILNVGYRFPAVGASDYPYCRALGDCRTYARLAGNLSAAEWSRAAAAGKSFFTTGPLLLLDVDGKLPGDTIARQGKGPHRVTARVKARCDVTPLTHVEIIANGRPVKRLEIPRKQGMARWLELDTPLDLSEPTWIAARAYSFAREGKPDAEAHTNPVYVTLDGKASYSRDDLDWLRARLDEQIAEQEKRRFPERERVLEYYRRSRVELLKVRDAGGQSPADRRD